MSLFEALEVENNLRALEIVGTTPSDVAIRDSSGRVALHYAAENMDTEVFSAVLFADVSLIDAQDENGFTPLFVAVTAGNVEALQLLINHGSQLDHVDLERHTAVHWAVVCGQLDTLEMLLATGAPPSTSDIHGANPLHYATTLEDIDQSVADAIVSLLLKAEKNVNCRDNDDRTPLLWAASAGNLVAIQRLFEAGANKYAVDRDHLNALHCAANHGYTAPTQLLLQQCGRKLSEGKDKNGDTPLFYACTYGHYECVRLLLEEANVDVNHTDKRLRTAAHCAAAKGQMRMLRLLRQFGASFDMQNYRGDLPLHEAVQTGNQEVVHWLLKMNSANLSVGNFYGRTALHLAAANGDLELIKLLCEEGAKVNALMIYRNQLCTPLDLARQRCHQPVVDYLTKNYEAKTANEFDNEYLNTARHNIEEDVRSAKICYTKIQNNAVIDSDEEEKQEDQEQENKINNELNENNAYLFKKKRSIFNNAEQSGKYLRNFGQQRLKLERRSKSVNNEQMRLSAINANNEKMVSREAQTDDELSHRIGRHLVEEAIRRVAVEQALLPSVDGQRRKYNGNNNKKLFSRSSSTENESTDDTKYKSTINNKHTTKKRVTMERKARVREYNVDTDLEDNADYDDKHKIIIKKPHLNSINYTSSSNLAHNALTSVEQLVHKSSNERFVHEKAIFQELTHLKRIQIQYGKVQERILVRSLINNFCKMHGLNPAEFRYTTFYTWEKFLYGKILAIMADQLKLIYLEERDRIHALAANVAPPSMVTMHFNHRIRRVSPLNDRIHELRRIYNSASTRRTLQDGNRRRRPCASVVDNTVVESGPGRRCNCLNQTNPKGTT